MVARSKKIALFGGSFDPPHLGHVAVVDYLSRQKPFDEVWILPSADHAFKKSQSPWEARLALCQLSFQDRAKVRVLDIEKNLSGYTFDTVEFLKAQYPQVEWTWILGSDLMPQLPQWKKIAELKKMVKFETLPRAPELASPFPPISSTEIRQKAKKGASLENLVVPAVEAYIKQHQLYQEAIPKL